jgi:hypothetical protein
MKVFALALVPAVALLLLAAHFYRAGLWPLALFAVLLNALLFIPRAWAARAVQVALLVAALEWLRTLAAFVGERVAAGQPYLRLLAILLAVTLFTGGAVLVFRAYPMRVRYGLGGRF